MNRIDQLFKDTYLRTRIKNIAQRVAEDIFKRLESDFCFKWRTWEGNHESIILLKSYQSFKKEYGVGCTKKQEAKE